MKKLRLKLDGIAQQLTKAQMKRITGGYPGGTCDMAGWTAHSNDWLGYYDGFDTQADAQAYGSQYGWTLTCHDSCLSSCCSAQPSFTGC